MNLNVHLETYGPISFKNGMPADFSSHLLLNASRYHATGPWGIICIQEIQMERHLLRHFIFSLHKTISIFIQNQDQRLQALLSLSGSFEHKINGLKKCFLNDKEYILLNAGNEETRITIYEGKLASLIHAFYAADSYQDILPLFPEFKRDLKKALRNPHLFNYPPKLARYSVHDAINAIWYDKYIYQLQIKHIEIRLERTLFTLLAQSYSSQITEPVSRYEHEKANAAREIILRNIKMHLSPEQIASELLCSVSWLKKAFSKVHGIGVFHFLRKTRMERAKEMLLRGESLKAVALEVGMKPQNFPKEFRAYFGYTVTALKKGQV